VIVDVFELDPHPARSRQTEIDELRYSFCKKLMARQLPHTLDEVGVGLVGFPRREGDSVEL
jgi:hypothetical protein